jgi:hypothetical protein
VYPNYYNNGGDMRDYHRISQFGLSPQEADEIAKRRGWDHTREGHAQKKPQ